MENKTRIKHSRTGRFQVTEIDLVLPGLPPSLEGYRMVQLSDLHFGACTKLNHIKQAIDIAKCFNPHLVLLTGDYVQYGATGVRHKLCTNVSPEFFGWFEYRRGVRELARTLSPILASLESPDGIFAVTGNHDYLEGIGTIYRQFPKNITWLNNKGVTIEKNSARIVVAGIDDLKKGRPDFSKVINCFTPNQDGIFQVNLCLSHNPDITIIPDSDILSLAHLILSGHTHGGQIRLPYFRPPITRTKQWKHVAGLSYHNKTPIYVTHGVGYGTMPIRLFCPPEVTLIKLVGR